MASASSSSGTTVNSPKHPAKFSKTVLETLNGWLKFSHGKLLDPFAGTGKIHQLNRPGLETWGVEIQPRWAAMHPRTIVGDALALPFPPRTFHYVATSVTYGNRLADHHNAKDGSVRHSYQHDYGEQLHSNNSGLLHFGAQYKTFHGLFYMQLGYYLIPGGMIFINCSNFIRKGEEVDVVGFHRDELSRYFLPYTELTVPTPRLRYGANAKARVESEFILVFRKGMH